jgi:hypothetical protein
LATQKRIVFLLVLAKKWDTKIRVGYNLIKNQINTINLKKLNNKTN